MATINTNLDNDDPGSEAIPPTSKFTPIADISYIDRSLQSEVRDTKLIYTLRAAQNASRPQEGGSNPTQVANATRSSLRIGTFGSSHLPGGSAPSREDAAPTPGPICRPPPAKRAAPANSLSDGGAQKKPKLTRTAIRSWLLSLPISVRLPSFADGNPDVDGSEPRLLLLSEFQNRDFAEQIRGRVHAIIRLAKDDFAVRRWVDQKSTDCYGACCITKRINNPFPTTEACAICHAQRTPRPCVILTSKSDGLIVLPRQPVTENALEEEPKLWVP